MLGLIGKKIGMTRVFYESGKSMPVTVVKVGPCVITQLKSEDKDGYSALQVGFEKVAKNKLKKPEVGHFEKNGLDCYKYLQEFKINKAELDDYEIGSQIDVNMFEENEDVDVTGTSKGRGFAGVIKRHNFSGKNMTHGTHEIFRGTGAVGQCATPSRIFKGKKMPGHMGNETVTVKNLRIVRVDEEKNVLMLKGAVPGHRNALVTIKEKNN